MNRYTIYGLNLHSDLDLPELSREDSRHTPDVTLLRGDVPKIWEETDPEHVRSLLDGAPQHLWIRIPGAVRMEVRGGRSITYTLEPGAQLDDARLFLLGSGLGALLMQREAVVMHGNAISRTERDDAIVCIGPSGAGKSTTAIAMMQRGYSILADDVCPIGSDGRIAPGMPRAKLWEEAATRLAIDTAPLHRIREGDAKYNLPLGERHCTTDRAVSAFVWLVPGDVAGIECHEITGVERFTVLRNNIYRPEFLGPLGLEQAYLRQVAAIASRTRVVRLVRPRAGFAIDALLDTISLLYEG